MKKHNNLKTIYGTIGLVLALAIALYLSFIPTNKPADATEYTELISAGREHLRSQNYEEAKEVFEQALELRTDDSVLYSNLYTTYYELGDYEKAKWAIQEVLKLVRSLGRYWINYAELEWQKLGATESEMRAIYQEAIEATKLSYEPSNMVDVHTNYAAYLTAIGDYSDAIDQLQRARELDPDRAEIYNGEIEWLRSRQ